jgi:superfamily II DNA or RNA helicase
MKLTLRDYQSRAVSDLRAAFRSGARAPLLVLPTGGGKTIIFAEITRSAAERGNRVLVLVHRRELVRQASTKLTAAGINHGIIASGIRTTLSNVQVASVQTLVRRLNLCKWSPDLIIIDEAHHASAGSWERVLNHWPEACRLGVTATPQRLDGRGLSDCFDHLVCGPSLADLTERGYLTSAKIYAPPVVADLSRLRTRAGDFDLGQASKRLNRPTVTGNAIDHYKRICPGIPAIAFCSSIEHAESVAAQFRASGCAAATLFGSTPPEQREQVIADLGAQRIDVLVSVDVISEGTDVPAAGVAILLRPTQSEALYLQQVGRVLRPAPGKSHAIILDHVGNVHRHGFPDDHREHSLEGRQRNVRTLSVQAPAVRTCSVCFAAFKPQPICPCCGTISQPSAREIEQREGELRELQRQEARTDYLRSRREQAAARSLDQLLAVAKQRGYAPGWAYRIHSARSARHG